MNTSNRRPRTYRYSQGKSPCRAHKRGQRAAMKNYTIHIAAFLISYDLAGILRNSIMRLLSHDESRRKRQIFRLIGSGFMKCDTYSIRQGYDKKKCLVHARCCYLSDIMVATAQYLNVAGVDLFSGILMSVSYDDGLNYGDLQLWRWKAAAFFKITIPNSIGCSLEMSCILFTQDAAPIMTTYSVTEHRCLRQGLKA